MRPPEVGDVYRAPASDYARTVRIVEVHAGLNRRGQQGDGMVVAENIDNQRRTRLAFATLARWTKVDLTPPSLPERSE